ncbi:hypothetical protein ASZ90_004585 [hydrocarbon metagenome]|uniref:Right handed beta helix domain-containing protein n=1 Tax=hydrocarbon metagenome TaxID=938273 RepID=A0A0W8FXE1_9ZZZZ
MKAKIAILFLLIVVCSFAQLKGPITNQVDLGKYSHLLFVSENGSDEKNNGTKENPFKTIQYAVSKANNLTESTRTAILVAEGIYEGETIHLKKFIDLFGGFNKDSWERDVELYTSEINIKKGQRAIVAADNNTIDGFTIKGAEIRGKGAAILCDGTSPVITNNIFINNQTLKPLDWNPKYWHDTANDGGAVYGKDGASPLIKNNLFVSNKTENGRGAAVAFDNECDPKIIDNVFYRNETGLDDPMRSSDGGAVSIFRWCKGLIEGNIFLSNYAGAKNDAGGVFIALWSSTIIRNNIFVDNESTDDAGALFVGGQEHRYDAPLDPFPSKEDFYVTIDNNYFVGNRNPSMNSGAMRFTMESRGEFTNNVVAYNNGVYFQRSETKITDNIILDNMLVIETKEYLDKTIIKDNFIWADFTLDETEAVIENNNMLDADKYPGNINKPLVLNNDGIELSILSAYYLKDKNHTELITAFDVKDDLVNRIIKSGDKWSVVKSHKNGVIQIWGNFSAITSLQVLPTYTLKK